MKLEAARSLREDYLHQDSFDEIDTYTSLKKQYRMLSSIMSFFYQGTQALERNAPYRDLIRLPVRDDISRLKLIPEDEFEAYADQIDRDIPEQIQTIQNREVQ